jgi:hypothetical protein
MHNTFYANCVCTSVDLHYQYSCQLHTLLDMTTISVLNDIYLGTFTWSMLVYVDIFFTSILDMFACELVWMCLLLIFPLPGTNSTCQRLFLWHYWALLEIYCIIFMLSVAPCLHQDLKATACLLLFHIWNCSLVDISFNYLLMEKEGTLFLLNVECRILLQYI